MSGSKRSVLVLGGTGFIGGNLLRKLISSGFQTTAIGFADRGQPERLSLVDGLNVLPAASSKQADMRACLSGHRFNFIINLTSGGVHPADRTPANLEESNSAFLVRLLEAVSDLPPELVIHAGSWSEYAQRIDKVPVNENHRLQYGSDYGGAKSIAERDGSACAARLGIAFVTLRLFHIYGPGEPEHRLMPYLISNMSAGHAADLTPGDQVRDFLFVDDMCDAFITILSLKNSVAEGAYNLCSAIPVSVRKVTETLADTLGFSHDMLRFGALPARPDEAAWVVGDNKKFEKATGWQPRHTLEEGINKTVSALLAKGNNHG